MIFSEMKFLEENTCICIDVQLSDQFIIQTKQSLCTLVHFYIKIFHQDMGIPCFLGGMARGLLGRYSPIQARQKRGEALKEADVVIMAGM